jgi:hypothetical protein
MAERQRALTGGHAPAHGPWLAAERRKAMRKLILTLVLVAVTIGVIGLTPSEAQAQRWRRWGGPYVSSYYYPSYGYSYSYSTPGYSYGYSAPGYTSYYSTMPSYSYGTYYTPSYSYGTYYTPGYSYGTYYAPTVRYYRP